MWESRVGESSLPDGITKEDAIQYTQELLRSMESANLLSILHEHYQHSHGVLSMPQAWEGIRHKDGVEKDSPTYWRVIFTCPVRGFQVASVLPVVWGLQDLTVLELYRKVVGDVWIDEESDTDHPWIYWTTKQNAKRAAALAYFIQESGGKLPKKLSKKEKAGNLVQMQKSLPPPPSLKLLEKIARMPNDTWADTLLEAGIRYVQIEYQIDAVRGPKTPSKVWKEPSLLTCRINATNTLSITEEPIVVESSPQPTASQALQNAVDRLLPLVPASYLDVKQELKDPRDYVRAKYDILYNNPSEYLVDYYIPYWAQTPVWEQSKGFLYEVEVYRLTGSSSCTDTYSDLDRATLPWASECIGVQEATPVGILLPNELPTPVTSIRCELQGVACLLTIGKRRSVVDLTGDTTTSQHQRAQWLRDLYTACCHWKLYGIQNLEHLGPTEAWTRKCSFVPLLLPGSQQSLGEMQIDWKLVEAIVTKTITPLLTPALRSFDRAVQRGQTWFELPLVSSILHSMYSLSEHTCVLQTNTKTSFAIGAISVFVQHLNHFPECRYYLPSNHFLIQAPRENSVFLAAPDSLQDASKTVISPINGTADSPTFMEYFQERFELESRYPSFPLLATYPVRKLAQQSASVEEEVSIPYHLVPEFTSLLPMPRDFLHFVAHVDIFLPALERKAMLQAQIQELEQKIGVVSSFSAFDTVVLDEENGIIQESAFLEEPPLIQLLDEATSLVPRKSYERLEFLGDKVVGYWAALCLFTINVDFRFDEGDLGEQVSAAVNNVAIRDAALRLSLQELILPAVVPWKEKQATTLSQGVRVSIAEGSISDMMESVLAAVFLHNQIDQMNQVFSGRLLSILNSMGLPMPEHDILGDEILTPSLTSFENGYDFGPSNPRWCNKLKELSKVLNARKNLAAQLESNAEQLVKVLLSKSTDPDSLLPGFLGSKGKTLLMIALFDANLDGTDASLREVNDFELKEFRKLGLMRDTMFVVGNACLELLISQDLYRMYPDATPGDLHLVKSCCICDDVLVYIFYKLGLHQFLFDQSAHCWNTLSRVVSRADSLGSHFWQERAGWILSGGSSAYKQRRMESFDSANFQSCDMDGPIPEYPGLMGGRLWGQKAKMDMSVTSDAQFSFKCIIGALALQAGSRECWYKLLQPHLQEVMMVSADEYRETLSKFSAICRTYGRGN
eukprot:Nitzschia sp. Nitz4//scaffold18_size181773//21860//25417//NITZ4_001897-RA/size181773-processed-gene-0.221-mRNA-1//-1//CDS//3329539957//1424//frame0